MNDKIEIHITEVKDEKRLSYRPLQKWAWSVSIGYRFGGVGWAEDVSSAMKRSQKAYRSLVKDLNEEKLTYNKSLI